jgi:hypothetical protein
MSVVSQDWRHWSLAQKSAPACDRCLCTCIWSTSLIIAPHALCPHVLFVFCFWEWPCLVRLFCLNHNLRILTHCASGSFFTIVLIRHTSTKTSWARLRVSSAEHQRKDSHNFRGRHGTGNVSCSHRYGWLHRPIVSCMGDSVQSHIAISKLLASLAKTTVARALNDVTTAPQ